MDIDPYVALGLSPNATLTEARQRINELNSAFAIIEAQLNDPSGPVNPENWPLSGLYIPDQPEDVASFWEDAGVQPIMIRTSDGTGLTLCTPTIDENDLRTEFLVSNSRLHLARNPKDLLDQVFYVWPALSRTLTASHIVVGPDQLYDLPATTEMLSLEPHSWNPGQFVRTYNLYYELSLALDIDDMYQALMPGTGLYTLYDLATEMTEPTKRHAALMRVDRLNLLAVFDTWSQIEDALSTYIGWH